MKILAINGSPRKGNTDFILDTLLKDSDIIKLREKKINFCGGGDTCCPINLKCHIKDDMLDIYEKIEAADIIILASPCYFSNVTARMKNFIDRCNPYYFNKKLKDKKFFLISVGGYEPSLKESIKSMEHFVEGIKGKVIGSYTAVADKKDELKQNEKIIKELKTISKELIKHE